PLYSECTVFGGAVASDLFARGLCLPSGSSLSESDLERVVAVIRQTAVQGNKQFAGIGNR
ncbi:MAG: pyridoxal phosphate-dependent aminotransferase, partial [Gemmatimonadaceae bacterium]